VLKSGCSFDTCPGARTGDGPIAGPVVEEDAMSRILVCMIVIGFSLGAARAQAQGSLGTEFTYQGRLTNAGSPASGLHDLRFRLYDALAGGTQVGMTFCADNVSVADGLFTVSLDFGAQFAGEERFLEIAVRADSGQDCTNPAGFVVLSSRQALTAAPHAAFALNADRLDGLDSTAFLQAIPNPLSLFGSHPSGSVVLGLNSSSADDSIGILGVAFAASGVTSGVVGQSNSTDGIGVKGLASSTSGITYGGRFETNSTLGYGVYGKSNSTENSINTYGVYGESSSLFGGFGVYGKSASAGQTGSGVHGEGNKIGVSGYALAASGSAFGGYFDCSSENGTGIYGEAGLPDSPFQTWGGYFRSKSNAGRGVYGLASAASGTNYGGLFESNSTDGRGVLGMATASTGLTYGGYFDNNSTEGRGVHATSAGPYGVFGSSTLASGDAYGGYFQSSSTEGTAVYGTANAATGTTYGGQFESDSTSGRGVYGLASATTGTTYGGRFESASTGGRGVYGFASATTGTTYGVFGGNSIASPFGFAVFAQGDLAATGLKSFRIDHPFDPENKYLLHYAAESPMPQNFYVGNVVTDGNGYAWVELPDYFAAINANFKYQLTVVDDADSDGFVMAKVSKEISGNRFQVRTSAPNIKVSWEIKADRNDLYVRYKKPKDVVAKEGLERGTYQHPELYGQPPEKGMDYDAERERPSPPAIPDIERPSPPGEPDIEGPSPAAASEEAPQ